MSRKATHDLVEAIFMPYRLLILMIVVLTRYSHDPTRNISSLIHGFPFFPSKNERAGQLPAAIRDTTYSYDDVIVIWSISRPGIRSMDLQGLATDVRVVAAMTQVLHGFMVQILKTSNSMDEMKPRSQLTIEGAIHHLMNGRPLEAERICLQILEEYPRNADAYHVLGIIAYQENKFREAIVLFREAIACNGSNAAFWCNLGLAYAAAGDLDESVNCYHKALRIQPDYPEALNNLGSAYERLQRFEDAISSYQKGISINPDFFEALYNLATVYHQLDRLGEAAVSYQRALSLRPEAAPVWNNLGALYKDIGEYDKALLHFQHALTLDPVYVESYTNIAALSREAGNAFEAIDSYQRALNLRHSDAVKIKTAMVLPVIMESRSDIIGWRARLENEIDSLLQTDIKLEDPVKQVDIANFYLAYHGLDDKNIAMKIANLYEKACPSLLYRAAHCTGKMQSIGGRKIRIGFVSKFMHHHTIGHYIRGFVSGLVTDLFDVYLYFLSPVIDNVTRELSARADKTVIVPPILNEARRIIEEDRLDILFYPEIGMDPFTYFLAFSRLAPVQCAFYGHPDTTGVGNIDFFISHEDCEPEDTSCLYKEEVLKISSRSTYTCYRRPRSRPDRRSPADFGLQGKDHIYLCPQSAFKIHPDMDDMIRKILDEDQRGKVVIFSGRYPQWTELLLQRLTSGRGEIAERVLVLHPLPHDDFLALMDLSHAILDTPHFSGGNTSFDAFSVGAPVVTLPGRFMRGRQTYALYKRMGFDNCIAEDADDYIRIAVRLGKEEDYRSEVRRTIMRRSEIIFNDTGCVRELEHLLAGALKKRGAY